jgi:Flp pilus assembly protein TadG
MLAMTAILGLGAIVLDGGSLYYQRARLQTAVDAAVLAGAQALPGGETAAQPAALDMALANGLAVDELEISVDMEGKTVSAEARRTVTLGLARVLRLSQADVSAKSTAALSALAGTQGAVPLGVVWQDFVFGQLYHLKLGDGTTGNYGALALGGTGAANYRENLAHGYPAWIRVGEAILTETGNMSNPTKSAVDVRIQDCRHQPLCSYDHFVPGCSKVVTVPIINALPNGRGEVTVLGFAAFFLEGVGGQGGDNYVSGRFVRMYAAGESGPVGNYGLLTVKLLR